MCFPLKIFGTEKKANNSNNDNNHVRVNADATHTGPAVPSSGAPGKL